MNFPENLKYTKDHEWVRVEGDEAYVGITDFAQSELGTIVYVEVETEGDTLDQAEVFGTIEAVKVASDLFMPVSGEVLEFNTDIDDDAEIINADPYKNWIIKIKLTEAGQLDELMDAAAYQASVSA